MKKENISLSTTFNIYFMREDWKQRKGWTST